MKRAMRARLSHTRMTNMASSICQLKTNYKQMKNRTILFLIVGVVFININSFGQGKDSIVKIEEQQTNLTSFPTDSLFEIFSKQQKEIIEIKNLLNNKNESSLYPVLGYILAFIVGLISALVSYRVGANQNKTNLKIKQIEIVCNDKERLSDLKKDITYRVLTNKSTTNGIVASLIDNVIYKILETLKLSEYFKDSFIAEINSTNTEYQRFAQNAMLNNNFSPELPQELLEKLKSADKLISINLDEEIRKKQKKIEELV